MRMMSKLYLNKRALVGVVVLVVALIVWPVAADGGVGDLKLIAKAPKADPFRPIAMTCKSFAPVDSDSGTINDEAGITRIFSDSLSLAVAVDSVKPDAERPDMVRLDFSGQGKFAGAPSFSLKQIPSATRPEFGISVSVFGPTAVTVQHDGKKIPVFVEGVCSLRDDIVKTMRISVGVVAGGACRFGDKTYGVRVIASDCLLGVNNAPEIDDSGMGSSGPGLQDNNPDAADVVMIDTSGAVFKNASVRATLGQLAYVDGKWYCVSVSKDGSKISAKQIAAETGAVSIAHDKWSAVLIGQKHTLSVFGGKAPVFVPADKYVIRRYRESEKNAVLTAAATQRSESSGLSFTVFKGKTASLKIGSPLAVKLKCDPMGSGYEFGISLQDACGLDASVTLPGLPAAPVVKITSPQGKEIHSGTMEYG
ncbi:MAG: hypothetical protein HN350_17610 [Phycisphaerales bacterium]|nr:hypothetical protein [Phycisphaerales bacterium]